MMEVEETWRALEWVVKNLDDIQVGPPVSGHFKIIDEASLEAIQTCIEDRSNVRGELGDCDEESLVVGKTVSVKLSPRFGFGLLTQNLSALLNAQSALIKAPRRFLLLEDLISYKDEVDENHLLSKYRAVLDFVQLLKQAAAYLDSDRATLIFFHDGKFDLPVEYTSDELSDISTAGLRGLLDVLPKDVHEQQRAAILSEVVIGMTKHLPSDKRFKHLLMHYAEVKKSFEEGYRLFAAGFSYEKIRDQVESVRVEYTGKIHHVLSDVQNQLLGIPVATIVVATQMKTAKVIGYEFWVNTSVLVGAWIFVILMFFLLNNQSQTVKVLENEIDRQKRQLTNEYAAISDTFSSVFEYLSKRARSQKNILWAIRALVVAGLVISHVVYFMLTLPAYIYLKSVLN